MLKRTLWERIRYADLADLLMTIAALVLFAYVLYLTWVGPASPGDVAPA
jgi:hypothetical protein